MCGRFTVTLKAKDLEEEYGVETSSDFAYESYNLAPSQIAPIVHLDEHQQRRLSMMEWGLLPSWAKNIKDTPRPINARLETADKNLIFMSSFQRRRCLIPSNGFFEWNAKTSPKQPYYFYEEDHSLFSFAGLWNIWEKEAGIILSFTIITKEAEDSVKPIHSRMPFVLNKEHYDQWLYEAQLPEKSPPLSCHPVGLNVNSPRNNDVSLISKVNQVRTASKL